MPYSESRKQDIRRARELATEVRGSQEVLRFESIVRGKPLFKIWFGPCLWRPPKRHTSFSVILSRPLEREEIVRRLNEAFKDLAEIQKEERGPETGSDTGKGSPGLEPAAEH